MAYENDPKDVIILLGSESDKKKWVDADNSKMTRALRACGVSYEMSVISTHRNLEELIRYCNSKPDALAFITAAGMSAGLPGVVAAITAAGKPVIGVALPSDTHPDGSDALESMVNMPPGTPVLVAGIGKAGLVNAAISAAQIVALRHPGLSELLKEYRAKTNKQPVYAIETSDTPLPEEEKK